MTLGELTTEARNVLRDPTVEASITTWVNQIQLELAGQFEVPQLRLRQAAQLTTTTTDWVYDLSECSHILGYEYHKKVVRVMSSQVPTGFIIESDFSAFDDADSTGGTGTHSDTGTTVDRVAIEGDQLGIYPMASDTLSLLFYRKPLDVDDDDDEPEVPTAEFHYRVLIPALVLRAFRTYPELAQDTPGDNTKALQLWTARLQGGLYGDGFQIGWVSKMQGQKGVRVRGPRLGQQLGGGWGRRLW